MNMCSFLMDLKDKISELENKFCES